MGSAAKFRNELRSKAKEKLGNKCAQCGSDSQLEFDHIDRSNKLIEISKAISNKNSVIVYEELEKCQLLCNPCHKEKNKVDNGEAKHGSLTMYTHYKCRCDECVVYAREYYKQYRREYRKRKSSCSVSGRTSV